MAVGMLMLMAACKDKATGGQGGDAAVDSLAVADSSIVVEDTTLQPMFLYYHNPKNMQVVFWAPLETPEDSYPGWELQERMRRNAARYTKLFMGSEVAQDVKFIGEQTVNPDGEPLDIFGLHHDYVPSAGLNYAFADADNPAGKNFDFGSMRVLTTADYLVDHKPLKLKGYDWGNQGKLPADVVKKLEQKYGMKVQRSCIAAKIGDRYVYGVLQFQVKDRKALALEVFVDGDKVYDSPVEGYYDESEGATWNVDDEGEYIPAPSSQPSTGPRVPRCATSTVPLRVPRWA